MHDIPSAVHEWCQTQGHGTIIKQSPVSGGCINNTSRLVCADGTSFFLKQNQNAAKDLFTAEATGLQSLSIDDGPRIPQVYLVHTQFLLMEFLDSSTPRQNYWQQFGQQLATVHNIQQSYFGFRIPTYCGATVQNNTPHDNGHVFFAEQRLLPLGRRVFDQGLLTSSDLQGLEHLCHALPQLIPEQKPAMLHGDLWSGNAHIGPHGEPCLIDPAVYFGWPEADLAMTTMFGQFPDAFYQAYCERHQLDPGYQDRFDLYNLYHYLNHAYLFGATYISSCLHIIRRFT